MAWIKRNLFFVISIAVGLLLTGYCAYLFCSSLSAYAGVNDDFNTALSGLQAIQQKTPYPSTENIQAIRADQEHVRMFLADFRKRFAPFPAPPVEDEKGFKTYLDDSIIQFRAEATNAGVQLPPDYSFAFSGLMGRLTYPRVNIEPWMQQLEEISTILDILYGAKINYLAGLQRTPVSADDTGATDILTTDTVSTNQWGVVAPYKITFSGFSAEIAAVMEGFARSSNCFVIKAIDVAPDPTAQQPVSQQPVLSQPATAYAPLTRYPSVALTPSLRGERGVRPVPVAVAAVSPGAAAAAAAAPPVTILSERRLLVTLLVDVVKLKASEH